MICVSCQKEDIRCIDDMSQEGYVAEIYCCNSCDGIIEVVYNNNRISKDNISTYRYMPGNEWRREI